LIISVVAWIFAEIVAMFSIVLNDGEETEIDCGVPGSCAASFSKSVIFFRIDIKRMSCCWLREMNNPIQERVKNYKKLDNDLKILQSGVSKLDKDAASLRTAYAKIKNDITQDVSSLQQNMSNVQTLYTTVESDEHSIQNKIQQADAKIKQDKRTSEALISCQQLFLDPSFV
jgi:uncharacterized protein YoxC